MENFLKMQEKYLSVLAHFSNYYYHLCDKHIGIIIPHLRNCDEKGIRWKS